MSEWNKIVKQLFHYGYGAANTYRELNMLCTTPQNKKFHKSVKSCSFGKLKWKKPNLEKIEELLYKKHSFSKERISSTLNRLTSAFEKTTTQTTLDMF